MRLPARRTRSVYLVAAVSALALVAAVPVASAADGFGFEAGKFTMATTAPGGTPSTQAGAHPDFTTSFVMNHQPSGIVNGDLKEIDVVLPPGLAGNATVTPKCTQAAVQEETCPADTVVGTLTAAVFNKTTAVVSLYPPDPLYNVVPLDGEPAAFAANVGHSFPVRIDTSVGPADGYRVHATTRALPEASPILETSVTLFGIPADQTGVGVRRALMTAPTECSGQPLEGKATGVSWEAPSTLVSASTLLEPVAGCDKLRFEPSIAVRPDTLAAGAPAGYAIDVSVPQSEDPQALGTPTLKDATVVLPRGVTLSPPVAHGLGACSDAQLGLHSNAAQSCPRSSNIGSVELTTPLLDYPLEGSVFVGEPVPGSRYRVFFVIEEGTVKIKLEGRVTLNPETGQISATFLDNPPLPFSNLHVELKGGPNAALGNPATCGVKTTTATLSSAAGNLVSPSASFTIDGNCGAGSKFDPGLHAGVSNPAAGKPSPFALQVTRDDGEQNLSRIDAALPEGVLAKLAGVPVCASAQAASGACPAASQVGTATVGVGAGSNPLYVPLAGKAPTAVYLAGPYKGAPYSLVVKVPAQAGPFDLGTISVRNALEIDPITTQVTAKSDPLPQILEGIPIAYRDVRVEVSRPDFTINPTNCDPMKVESTIVSADGKSASPSAPFQASNCERLGFKPKLALSLSGKTNRSAHPKLRAVLTARKGDANIGRAQVTLPKTEFLENAHIQTICTRVQFAAKACPAKSVYGYAKAWSPLLDKPLAGPVYLRSSSHELPDLVASLDGQIHVDLQGRIDSVRSRIRNTFDFVPDAPVSKFVLAMEGGKKGLLVNNTELCKTTPRAQVALDAQNGKTSDSNPVAKTDCGKGRKAKK
jgi:hypothetical protein